MTASRIARASVVLALLLATGGSVTGEESRPPAANSPPVAAAASPPPVPAPPDVAAPPADATKTETGLAFRILRKGTGTTRPVPTDLVTVHYTGWKADGSMIDSSVQRGKPVTMPLKRFIPGWLEGLQLMVAGEERRFWIPESLAFQGNPTAPKGMMVYDIELLDVKPGPETPPPDVAGPPEGAERTASGLFSRVLGKGTGQKHPSPRSQVVVNYTGWTTDGKMFDSSVTRGRPATFRLDQVIQGWTEGLQRMVEGEKRRFWIPEKLAYKGQEGRPKGMLVFDVELIAIQN